MPTRHTITRVTQLNLRTDKVMCGPDEFIVLSKWGAEVNDQVVITDDGNVHIKKHVIDKPFKKEPDLSRLKFKIVYDRPASAPVERTEHQLAMHGRL